VTRGPEQGCPKKPGRVSAGRVDLGAGEQVAGGNLG